jgi:hypothetical protein
MKKREVYTRYGCKGDPPLLPGLEQRYTQKERLCLSALPGTRATLKIVPALPPLQPNSCIRQIGCTQRNQACNRSGSRRKHGGTHSLWGTSVLCCDAITELTNKVLQQIRGWLGVQIGESAWEGYVAG